MKPNNVINAMRKRYIILILLISLVGFLNAQNKIEIAKIVETIYCDTFKINPNNIYLVKNVSDSVFLYNDNTTCLNVNFLENNNDLLEEIRKKKELYLLTYSFKNDSIDANRLICTFDLCLATKKNYNSQMKLLGLISSHTFFLIKTGAGWDIEYHKSPYMKH